MKRKRFLFSLLSILTLGLFKINTKEEFMRAFIFNDDGSKMLKEFEKIKYADYFQLVNPDGSLRNGGEIFLATSNPYIAQSGRYKGEWAVDIYEERKFKKTKNYLYVSNDIRYINI